MGLRTNSSFSWSFERGHQVTHRLVQKHVGETFPVVSREGWDEGNDLSTNLGFSMFA